MSAAIPVTLATPAAGPTLREPYAGLDAGALLEHFRSRHNVQYFPVPDAAETTRERIDAICAGTFEFNGEAHRFSGAVDWLTNPSTDVEWHILLHKFYYAVGLGMAWSETRDRRYADRWAEMIDSWIEVTPPGFIAVDVAGRRVQNWIYAYHHFVETDPSTPIDPQFHLRMLTSIEQQVEHICANLTPKRNHRTLELYAVFLAGAVFPEFTRAEHWRRFGIEELARNIEADLLPDGVHCELSTDYHHLVVKNYLCARRVAQLNGIVVPAALDAGLQRALEFSMYAHKPDGIVPSLSDGDARGFLELLRQGHELYGRDDFLYVGSGGAAGCAPTQRLAIFENSGYSIARSGWGEATRRYADEHYLVFDSGPLGEGNHGHFDCLSFELAANGRSLVVDPGRYTYSEAGDINWRVRFRSTASHNTVLVDGLNQTRYTPKKVADGTRHATGSVRHRIAGPAPVARLEAAVDDGQHIYLCGSARSNEYDAVHTRHILFAFGDYWILADRLDAPGTHRYTQRFQLGPNVGELPQVECADGTTFVRSDGLTLAFPENGRAVCSVQPSWVSFEYGSRMAAPAVCVEESASDTWMIALLVADSLRDRRPVLRLLPHMDAGSVAFEVALTGTGSPLLDRFVLRAPDPAWRDIDGQPIECPFSALRLGDSLQASAS